MGSLRSLSISYATLIIVLTTSVFLIRAHASDKKDAQQYGEGFIANVPYAEADVIKVVDDVVQNGKILGTKEYNKDEFVGNATPVENCPLFPAWTDGGKVFFKERLHALDPRNFKESNDVGTLAVRYVVMRQDDKHTVIRIDAIFVEEFRHKSHASDGSVENAEYKEIHDHLEAIQLMRDQAAEAEKQKQEAEQRKFDAASEEAPTAVLEPSSGSTSSRPQETVISDSSSIEDLRKRAHELSQLTQRKVKKTGTSLKSAPFRTAADLEPLGAGVEVLIVISTPYWYGVETHGGQHGWVFKDDLEGLP